ncbi:uncharacterized protein [Amphiura filiformis]|uniref:uncharacterized protein n=1 Tax=Amphiura filiformis TaxID=82378 RepID=UPI003B21CD36
MNVSVVAMVFLMIDTERLRNRSVMRLVLGIHRKLVEELGECLCMLYWGINRIPISDVTLINQTELYPNIKSSRNLIQSLRAFHIVNLLDRSTPACNTVMNVSVVAMVFLMIDTERLRNRSVMRLVLGIHRKLVEELGECLCMLYWTRFLRMNSGNQDYTRAL